MAPKTIRDDRFELSASTPLPLRIGLGAVGAFIAIMVAKDLWRGLWPLSILTPFFLLLFGVGLFIGLTLVAAMIWGPDEHWVIAKGRITVTRSLRNFRSEKTHKTAEIQRAEIVTETWDSRADTFRLSLVLTSGKTLRSPDFPTHGAAENARRLLLNA